MARMNKMTTLAKNDKMSENANFSRKNRMVKKTKTAEIFKMEENHHTDHIDQLGQNGRIGQ